MEISDKPNIKREELVQMPQDKLCGLGVHQGITFLLIVQCVIKYACNLIFRNKGNNLYSSIILIGHVNKRS